MKLLSLSVENFAGLPDRTFSFATRSGGAARAVLVVGGPAAGKSSLLAAIIAAKEHIAPYGKRPSLASRARQSGRDVVIQTVWELDEEERASTGAASSRLEATVRGGTSDEPTVHSGALVELLKRYNHLPSVGKVELFAEHRALASPPLRPARMLTETEERLHRLADDPLKYRGVWACLREHAIAGPSASVAPLLEALGMLGCPISAIRLDEEAVFFQDLRDNRLRTEQLSAAARDTLLVAATLRRVGHERSVILFDRLELFRPVDAAIELFRSLLALTGRSQVVATTSLRDVASSGFADVLIDLENASAPVRAPEDRQPAERPPVAPTSAPESAVASPVRTLLEPAAPIAVERALSTYQLRNEEEIPPAPELLPMNSADETAMVDPLATAKGQSLPFAPDSPLARLARLREEAARERIEAAAPRPAPGVERGTVALPDGVPTSAAIPFEEISPEAVDLTMFPLDRYAEITVALARGDDRAAVLRRFVMTEGMWRAITQAWASRIERDPTLRAEFHAVVERLRRQG